MLFLLASGGILAGLIGAWCAFREPPDADGSMLSAHRVYVHVGSVYRPERIQLKAGRRVRLVFTLTREAPSCANQVVLEEFGLSAELPLGKAVALVFTPRKPGEYAFGCPQHRVQGRLLVD